MPPPVLLLSLLLWIPAILAASLALVDASREVTSDWAQLGLVLAVVVADVVLLLNVPRALAPSGDLGEALVDWATTPPPTEGTTDPRPVRGRLKVPLLVFFAGFSTLLVDQLVIDLPGGPDEPVRGWAWVYAVVFFALVAWFGFWEVPRATLSGNWMNRSGLWVLRRVYGVRIREKKAKAPPEGRGEPG